MSERYSLRCRECHRDWGNRPGSICEDCLAPLEVVYDMDFARATFTRQNITARPANLWRYAELLPLPEGFSNDIPVGMTPLVRAPRLGAQLGSRRLVLKNDAVCYLLQWTVVEWRSAELGPTWMMKSPGSQS